MSNHICPICNNTGMTQSGFLDCSYRGCTAAAERAVFNERMGIQGPWMLLEVAWSAYQMGRKDEKELHDAK